MSGLPCYVIITGSDDTIQANSVQPPGPIHGGEDAQAALDLFIKRFPAVNTVSLSHALDASCEGTAFASIYLAIKGQYIDEMYTDRILEVHENIVQQLSRYGTSSSETRTPQQVVDILATALWKAVVYMRGAFSD